MAARALSLLAVASAARAFAPASESKSPLAPAGPAWIALYRMPGSGLSIFTGVAQTFSTRGPRTGKDHLSPGLDTAHWTSAPGPGQELVRLNTGKLGGLGVRGKRISGRDLVAMYAAASHSLCRGASARE